MGTGISRCIMLGKCLKSSFAASNRSISQPGGCLTFDEAGGSEASGYLNDASFIVTYKRVGKGIVHSTLREFLLEVGFTHLNSLRGEQSPIPAAPVGGCMNKGKDVVRRRLGLFRLVVSGKTYFLLTPPSLRIANMFGSPPKQVLLPSWALRWRLPLSGVPGMLCFTQVLVSADVSGMCTT